MPELPEVETIRKQLDAELTGYTFVSVKTDWEKSFRPSFRVISKVIVGKEIKSIDRQAKLIIFRLGEVWGLAPQNEEAYLLFHLKLTGQLLVRKPLDPADKYVRSVFTLRKVRKIPDLTSSDPGSDRAGKELRFADARKFGFVKFVTDQKEMADLLKGYGPEPFTDLTLAKFEETLRSSGRPVKIVLLDQTEISGLGNIYANDALWLARVDPRTPSSKITRELGRRLYDSILEVLKRGLRYGGASDQWYVQTHGEKGQYQEHFLVYGQKGKKCQRCGTIINRITIGGRGTFFCPKCQGKNKAQ